MTPFHSLPAPITGVLLAAALACNAAAAQPNMPAPDRAAAEDAYERGRYDDAFTLYARLADGGDCDAARVAVLMLRWGPRLYARAFAVEPGRAQRWRATASCAPVVALRTTPP